MSNELEKYFVRIRGKIAGPFTITQLEKLKARGQFRRVHEVSTDGRDWEPAGNLPALFPARQQTRKTAASVDADAAVVGNAESADSGYGVVTRESSSASQEEWYYSVGDGQFGPVAFEDLVHLVNKQKLNPDDMIWSPGMASWKPAGSERRLFPDTEHTDSEEQSDENADVVIDTRRERQSIRGSSQQSPQVSHILQLMVETMHGWFTDEQLRSANLFFIRAGNLAMYLTMLAVSVYYIVVATRQDSLGTALVGGRLVLIVLALQYAGVRLFQTMNSLVESTPSRMSTTAFADSLAVLFVAMAIVILVSGIYAAVQYEQIDVALFAICGFCGCQFGAIVALNPSFLNVTASSGASTGEEAIGMFSFIAMLFARTLPIVYTFWVAAVAALWGIALYDLFNSSTAVLSNISDLTTGLLSVAATPVLGYIAFITYYLIVDVLRVVLVLPSTLEAMQPHDSEK